MGGGKEDCNQVSGLYLDRVHSSPKVGVSPASACVPPAGQPRLGKVALVASPPPLEAVGHPKVDVPHHL